MFQLTVLERKLRFIDWKLQSLNVLVWRGAAGGPSVIVTGEGNAGSADMTYCGSLYFADAVCGGINLEVCYYRMVGEARTLGCGSNQD